MAKQTVVTMSAKLVDVVSSAFSELESLGGEYREWYDNLPEGLQDHRSDIDEAASTLENLTEPDAGSLPEAVADIAVTYTVSTKKKQSRRDRGEAATSLLTQVVEELQDWMDKNEGDTDVHDTVEAYRDEVQQMLDDAEGVEYPGMFA